MANVLKSAYSTLCAGTRVIKEGAKFVGRNANKGGAFVLDKATAGLDKLANKMAENQEQKVEATEVKEGK